MRKLTGWAAAALVAATGCGGGSPASNPTIVTDEHEGEDKVCAECKVTGGGVFFLDGQRVTFGLNAVPTGSGAAEGHIEIQLHDPDDGTNIFGTVDTIVSCSRDDGVLIGTFQGTLRDGATPFEVTVEDAGEPGRDDTIQLTNGIPFGPIALEQGGNLQVHELDQCQLPPCPEGQCICPDDPTQCEPCEPPSEPPPPTCVPLGSACTQQDTCCSGYCGTDSICRPIG
jgi:hypothetical protein